MSSTRKCKLFNKRLFLSFDLRLKVTSSSFPLTEVPNGHSIAAFRFNTHPTGKRILKNFAIVENSIGYSIIQNPQPGLLIKCNIQTGKRCLTVNHRPMTSLNRPSWCGAVGLTKGSCGLMPFQCILQNISDIRRKKQDSRIPFVKLNYV